MTAYTAVCKFTDSSSVRLLIGLMEVTPFVLQAFDVRQINIDLMVAQDKT